MGFILEGESNVYDNGDNDGADDDDDDNLLVGVILIFICDINDDMLLIRCISIVFARCD